VEFLDISRVSEAITAKRMKIDPYCQRRNFSPLHALFSDVLLYRLRWYRRAGAFTRYGASNKCGWGKHAIFEPNASISLARWRWRLLHYFKQVANLSATCFHVELEQFSACFRVARVCQCQLGFKSVQNLSTNSIYTIKRVPADIWK